MDYELHKISVSGEEKKFTTTNNQQEYEILFDNCASVLRLSNLFSEENLPIEAESMWSDTGKRIKDTFIVRSQDKSAKFPETEGYKVFSFTWSSSAARDDGFIVVKLL